MVVALVIFTVALVAFLNFSNYRKTYAELTRSGYLVLANDLKQSIEYALNLGLPLGQLTQAQQLMTEIKSREPNIRFIHVFSDQGKFIFSTEPDTIGTPVNTAWLGHLDRVKQNAHWQDASEQAYLVAIPVVNNFDVKVGAVLIGYSKQEFDKKAEVMQHRLGLDALSVLAGFLLLTIAGVFLILRKLEVNVAFLEHSLNEFIEHPNSVPPSDKKLDVDLQHDILEFEEISKLALEAIKASAQQLGPKLPGSPKP